MESEEIQCNTSLHQKEPKEKKRKQKQNKDNLFLGWSAVILEIRILLRGISEFG